MSLLFCSLQRGPDKSIDSLFSKVFPVGFLREVELGPFPVKLPARAKLFQQCSPFCRTWCAKFSWFPSQSKAYSDALVAGHLKCLPKLLKEATSMCALTFLQVYPTQGSHLHLRSVFRSLPPCGLPRGKMLDFMLFSEALLRSQ